MARFQSFWEGEELPPYQQLAAKSFIDHGHEYRLYSYRHFDVPAGVQVFDARSILPESRLFRYGDGAGVGQGSVAGFSNLFRYCVLHEHGEWWVDADVVCLSSRVPQTDLFMSWEYDREIGSAILKIPARHDFARTLRDEAEALGSSIGWGQTGPTLVTRLARELDLLAYAVPQPVGYPVQSMDALHLLLPERRDEVYERMAGRPFLHIWNEVQRRAVIFPWMAPPPGSVLAELLAHHGIKLPHSRTYTGDQVKRLSDNYYAAATWSHRDAENAEIARLTARLERLRSEKDALRTEMAAVQQRLGALLNSRSWRFAAPLRALGKLFRRSLSSSNRLRDRWMKVSNSPESPR